MNEDVTDIAKLSVSILRPHLGSSKYSTQYFQANTQYADSFIRARRPGTGFLGFGKPAASTAIATIEINITLRPNVLGPEWVGYTLCIDDPETNPKLVTIQQWPQAGGQQDAPEGTYSQLKAHVEALLSVPLTDTTPPREAPDSMF